MTPGPPRAAAAACPTFEDLLAPPRAPARRRPTAATQAPEEVTKEKVMATQEERPRPALARAGPREDGPCAGDGQAHPRDLERHRGRRSSAEPRRAHPPAEPRDRHEGAGPPAHRPGAAFLARARKKAAGRPRARSSAALRPAGRLQRETQEPRRAPSTRPSRGTLVALNIPSRREVSELTRKVDELAQDRRLRRPASPR